MKSFSILLTSMLPFFFPQCNARFSKPCGKVDKNMSCVPGTYMIKGSNKGIKRQKNAQSVYVDTFHMNKYEVTAGQYDKCYKSKKCPYQHTNYKGFSGKNQPKIGISWYAAKKYCEVQGKRLATEAEWELSARGPDGDQYPWGNSPEPNCKLVVMEDKTGKGCGRKGKYKDKGTTWDVGSFPPYRYGLYDIIGNADEWVNDWYSKDYKECGKKCRGINPKGPCDGRKRCSGYINRIVKGGSWYWNKTHLYGSYRRPHLPGNKKIYHHFGFRCAKSRKSKIDKYIDYFNKLLSSED
jgi:formylglycine-generating enzyme required for sulfatase activity